MSAPATPPVAETPVRGILDVIVFSSITALAVILAAVKGVVDVFRAEGPAVPFPMQPQPVTATLGSAGAADTYIATGATVLAPGLDTATLLWFAASIVTAAVAVLIVLAALVRLALAFRAGRLFTPVTARSLTIIGGTMFLGACLVLITDALGRSGTYAMLGIPWEPLHMIQFVPYLPIWVASIAISMLAGVFERGRRMQRDSEGLV